MSPPIAQHAEDGDRKIGREPQKTSVTRTNLAAHFIAGIIAGRRRIFSQRLAAGCRACVRGRRPARYTDAMRRRLASALCLIAICVAAGVSAFVVADCCGAEADCAPCASMLCWVGQCASAPRLSGPIFHEYSGSATLPDSVSELSLSIMRECSLAFAGEPFDTSPPGFRLSLRV